MHAREMTKMFTTYLRVEGTATKHALYEHTLQFKKYNMIQKSVQKG